MQHFRILSVAAVALIACVGAHPSAHADSVFVNSGPANYCRPALPAFDGQIRTRPLAVQNESDSTAFVTCSMASESGVNSAVRPIKYYIVVSNPSSITNISNCTAVAGRAGTPAGIESVTRSAVLAAGVETLLEWGNDDFSGADVPLLMSFSCALGKGAAINDMYVELDDGL